MCIHIIEIYVIIQDQGYFLTLDKGYLHMKIKTGFSQKAEDHFQPNFVCKLFHMRKIKFNGMMLST